MIDETYCGPDRKEFMAECKLVRSRNVQLTAASHVRGRNLPKGAAGNQMAMLSE